MFTLRFKNSNIRFMKSYTYKTYLNDNFKALGDDFKNKTDILINKTGSVIDESLDTTLCNMLKALKMTEQKIKLEKLDNVEISASISIGLVSIQMTKKIVLE